MYCNKKPIKTYIMTKEQKQKLSELAQKRIADATGFEAINIYLTNIEVVGVTAIIGFSIMSIIDGADFNGSIVISLV